jgi:hypothetical protein
VASEVEGAGEECLQEVEEASKAHFEAVLQSPSLG